MHDMHDVIYKSVTEFPKMKRQLLRRHRLDVLLSKAVEHPLITVIAGAGYGKTQAVSMFLNQLSARVMWFQLSELDNHLTRFWEEFVYSMAFHSKEAAAKLEQLGFPESLAKFDQFLRILAKDIYAGKQVVFVLDDFHLIYNELIIRFWENIIYAKLDNFSIVLISRTDLPVNLSGVLTSDMAARITAEDLRFTLSETEDYLKLQNIILPAKKTDKIQIYTEGWPLALYLVSLSIKKHGMIANDPIAGAIPSIFNMIERELFSEYAPQVQNFLIKVSLLNTFPKSIIEALTGEFLDTVLEAINTNMFIYYNPYSGHYTVHRLFLDFLIGKQELLTEDEITGTYLKVAAWYASNEEKIDALTYYDKCGRYDKIWDIMLHYGPATFSKTTADFFMGLIDKFPKEFVKKNPMVHVIRAGLLLNSADVEQAIIELSETQKELEAQPPSADNQTVLGEIYIMLGLLSMASCNYNFKDFFKKACECFPSGSIIDHTGRAVNTKYSIMLNTPAPGELKKMEEALFYAVPYMSKVLHGYGHGMDYLAAAEAAYFTGDMRKAAKNAYEAVYRARDRQVSDVALSGYFLLMRIEASNGNYNGVVSHLKQLKAYAGSIEDKLNFNGMPDIAEGWLYVMVGQMEMVASWIMDDALNDNTPAPYSMGMERTIKSRCLLREGKYYELLAWLGPFETLARRNNAWLILLDILISKSIAFHHIDDGLQTIRALQEAYEIAHGNNLVMQFAELGNDMRAVINSVRRSDGHTITKKWMDGIYAKANTHAKRMAYITVEYNRENKLITTTDVRLSKREKEILVSLYQGLTREEIAESLYISVSTVKNALNSIYSKLGALNSVDAVRIAAQKKII